LDKGPSVPGMEIAIPFSMAEKQRIYKALVMNDYPGAL
jgi:hypothetical protein